MRVLALDYGSARCGCALSDPTGTLATPIEPVLRPATRKGMARIAGLVRERGVKAGDVVKVAAQIAGGGGGGRDTMAQAGGRDPDKLPEAIEAARAAIVHALG